MADKLFFNGRPVEITTSMMTLIIIGCSIGIIILIALMIGFIFIMQSGERDTVSTAREGWIRRRSEKDEDGW